MLVKVGLGVGVFLVAFLAYVATRPSSFRYERSGLIKSLPEKIFPYISELRRGNLWSPYQQKDPSMKSTFTEPDNVVGAKMEFEGGKEVGAGSIEILKTEPSRWVQMKLVMLKPFKAENLVEYTLKPEGDGTLFTWTMSGESGFLGKFVSVIIDCDAMIAGDFEKGIANLKKLVEAENVGSFKNENLTQTPQLHHWPVTHYVYTEKVGPFMQTAQGLWGDFHKAFPEILKNSKVNGTMALYKMEPEMIYRAGAIVDAEPKSLPAGFKYEKFEGGKYWKFTLKGSYTQLPEASGRVFEIAKASHIGTRDGFYIEHYANDPSKTPEDQLITEILIPTK